MGTKTGWLTRFLKRMRAVLSSYPFLPFSPSPLLPLSLPLPLLFLAVGCDLPGRPKRADRPVPADKVMDFRTLYGQNCAGCHGVTGTLGPAPPLNDPLFRAIVPEDELTSIITRGRHKTLMPAFAKTNGGTLTSEQIEVLVHEIKGTPYKRPGGGTGDILPEWGAPKRLSGHVPPYRAPAADRKADVKNGAVVFARACAGCHGADGKGTMALTIHDRTFLTLLSDQALRRLVITGRPDLAMPSHAEARPGDPNFQALTDAEVSDLVALLASWRQEK